MNGIDIAYLLRSGNTRQIPNATFADYIVAATEFFRENDQRLGQSYFNALHLIRPDIADKIRGSNDDAFYSDDLLPRMLKVVYTSW